MTANSNMTVAQMKDYIRQNKLNKPHLRLGMKRAELIAGFKKEGRWREVAKGKKTTTKKKTIKHYVYPFAPKMPPRPKAMAKFMKEQGPQPPTIKGVVWVPNADYEEGDPFSHRTYLNGDVYEWGSDPEYAGIYDNDLTEVSIADIIEKAKSINLF